MPWGSFTGVSPLYRAAQAPPPGTVIGANRSWPFYANLIGGFALNSGGGMPQWLTGGAASTITNKVFTTGTPRYANSAHGVGLYGDGSTASDVVKTANATIFGGLSAITAVCVVRFSTAAANSMLVTKNNEFTFIKATGTTTVASTIWVGSNSYTTFNLSIDNISTFVFIATWVSGNRLFTYSFNTRTHAIATAFNDTVLTGTINSNSSTPLCLLGNETGSGLIGAVINNLFFLNRSVSYDEVSRIFRSPYSWLDLAPPPHFRGVTSSALSLGARLLGASQYRPDATYSAPLITRAAGAGQSRPDATYSAPLITRAAGAGQSRPDATYPAPLITRAAGAGQSRPGATYPAPLITRAAGAGLARAASTLAAFLAVRAASAGLARADSSIAAFLAVRAASAGLAQAAGSYSAHLAARAAGAGRARADLTLFLELEARLTAAVQAADTAIMSVLMAAQVPVHGGASFGGPAALQAALRASSLLSGGAARATLIGATPPPALPAEPRKGIVLREARFRTIPDAVSSLVHPTLRVNQPTGEGQGAPNRALIAPLHAPVTDSVVSLYNQVQPIRYNVELLIERLQAAEELIAELQRRIKELEP